VLGTKAVIDDFDIIFNDFMKLEDTIEFTHFPFKKALNIPMTA